jgi:LPS export ABC transporter protein LptC
VREFIRNWGSCLGVLVLIGVVAGAGFWAYRIDEGNRRAAPPPGEEHPFLVMTDTVFQVWSSGDEPALVAEIEGQRVEVNRSQSLTDVFGITALRLFREGNVFLAGTAEHAEYDKDACELRVTDGVDLYQEERDLRIKTEAISYYTDSEVFITPKPVTAEMRGATLRTRTVRFNVATEQFQAPRQISVTTAANSTLVADSANGDLAEERLSLFGNVVMDATVRDIRQMASESEAGGAATVAGARDDARVRIRCGRADLHMTDNTVSASEEVTIVTEEGSITGQTADMAKGKVTLGGGTTLALRGTASDGPLTVETARIEYDTETDLAECPAPVTVRMKEGEFHAASARATLRERKWRLSGGVKGSLRFGVR